MPNGRKGRRISTSLQARLIRLAINDARSDAKLWGNTDGVKRPRWDKAHILWHISGVSLTWEQELYRKAYTRTYESVIKSIADPGMRPI